MIAWFLQDVFSNFVSLMYQRDVMKSWSHDFLIIAVLIDFILPIIQRLTTSCIQFIKLKSKLFSHKNQKLANITIDHSFILLIIAKENASTISTSLPCINYMCRGAWISWTTYPGARRGLDFNYWKQGKDSPYECRFSKWQFEFHQILKINPYLNFLISFLTFIH